MPATGSSLAHSATSLATGAPPEHSRPHLRTVPARVEPRLTLEHMLRSWQRSLEAAAQAVAAAYEEAAISPRALADFRRRLRDERMWLSRLERDSRALFL